MGRRRPGCGAESSSLSTIVNPGLAVFKSFVNKTGASRGCRAGFRALTIVELVDIFVPLQRKPESFDRVVLPMSWPVYDHKWSALQVCTSIQLHPTSPPIAAARFLPAPTEAAPHRATLEPKWVNGVLQKSGPAVSSPSKCTLRYLPALTVRREIGRDVTRLALP